MFFKTLFVYEFTEPFGLTADDLAYKLAAHKFTPCTEMQESSFGWVPSYSRSELHCEQVEGCLVFTAKIQTKEIKPAAINELLHEKLDAIAKAEDRRPGKKEREQIKEDIRAELLPKTPRTSKKLNAYINRKTGHLVVDAGSEKAADNFTSYLREAIGTLSILPVAKTQQAPITEWFDDPNERPQDSEFLSDLSLTMVQDSAVKATYRNLDLDDKSIRENLDGGMRITKAKMSFNDQVIFSIDEKYQFRSVKFDEQLIDQGNESEDPRADTILMISTLTALFAVFLPKLDREPI